MYSLPSIRAHYDTCIGAFPRYKRRGVICGHNNNIHIYAEDYMRAHALQQANATKSTCNLDRSFLSEFNFRQSSFCYRQAAEMQGQKIAQSTILTSKHAQSTQ